MTFPNDALGPLAPVSAIAWVIAPLSSSCCDRRWQIGVEDGDFRFLLRRKIGAAPGVELLDRIAPLFHQTGNNLKLFRWLEQPFLLYANCQRRPASASVLSCC